MRNAAELDRALGRWADALAKSRDSISHLKTDSRWDLLSGPLRQVFSGRTAATLAAACAAGDRLSGGLSALEAMLARARAQQPGVWASAAKIDEAFALLEGQSIILSVDELPLHERGLLSPARTTTAITPDAALAAMETDFGTASAGIATIHAAWRAATETQKRLDAEIDALAGTLGRAQLAALRAEAKAASNAALTDPLADHPQIDLLAQRLDGLRETVANAETRAAEAREAIDRAGGRLAALGSAIAAATQVCRMAAESCADPLPPVPVIDAADLGAWLARIETRLDAGDPAPVQAGVEAWLRPVMAAEAAAETALTAATSLMRRRDEARGRLMAAKRKAHAVADLGNDPALQALAEQAQSLLIGRRSEVAAGEVALRKFELAVERARSPLAPR